jgi:hypothetical protein
VRGYDAISIPSLFSDGVLPGDAVGDGS